MEHLILGVQPHGVAYRRGIRAGDSLVAGQKLFHTDLLLFRLRELVQRADMMTRYIPIYLITHAAKSQR